MNLIITLVLCILISFLFSLLFKKLGLSIVIGYITAGIIIGLPTIKNLILEPNTDFILNIGVLGLVFLMFLAGMETSIKMIKKEKKDALFIALFGALVPFLLGFIVFFALGFSTLTSLVIGVCMSITAESTKARVLMEFKKLKTRLGALMIEAGIIDDIIGISLFILISYFLTSTFEIKELMLLIIAIAAFFMGILANKFMGRKHPKISSLENILLVFIIPFFFISMGIHFNLKSLILNPLLLIIIIIIAITGKIGGVLLTKPFTKLSLKQLYLIGWGMNSRGAVELAIAFIAFHFGLLNSTLYSSIVIMTLVTTILFILIFKRMIRKNPGIMN